MNHQDVFEFWFSDRVRKNWWSKISSFDQEIRDRFGETYERAVNGELASWRETPQGRLSEIIVLDQFPRNMFRDRPEAFLHDPLAQSLTREAVVNSADQQLDPTQNVFLYMPLMHSESPADHDQAVQLYSSHPDLANNLQFEHRHKAIIDRFGRYPHRNICLGRTSTDEELEFLGQPGSSF